MDTTRIKIKIGEHEFEAEGPTKIVQDQFEAFKSLISTLPHINSGGAKVGTGQTTVNKGDVVDPTHVDLAKIMRVSGRVVSLTAIPASSDDAALLILLGQKDLRDNTSSTALEVGDGLAESGRKVTRVDGVMESGIKQGFVLR